MSQNPKRRWPQSGFFSLAGWAWAERVDEWTDSFWSTRIGTFLLRLKPRGCFLPWDGDHWYSLICDPGDSTPAAHWVNHRDSQTWPPQTNGTQITEAQTFGFGFFLMSQSFWCCHIAWKALANISNKTSIFQTTQRIIYSKGRVFYNPHKCEIGVFGHSSEVCLERNHLNQSQKARMSGRSTNWIQVHAHSTKPYCKKMQKTNMKMKFWNKLLT